MPGPVLESLSEQECLELLKGVKYGRVAVVTQDGRPTIFPVNFTLHGRTVVFVTGSAMMQARAPLGHVAFEADDIDPSTHEGWDVVVSGEGADITGSLDAQSLMARERQDRSLGAGAERALDVDHQPPLQRPAPRGFGATGDLA